MAQRHQTCGMSIEVTPRGTTLSDRLAEEIRALLARRKISGRELARQLDVSPSWISYRLTGQQPIDVNDLAAIAEALGIQPVDLLRAADEGTTLRYRHTPVDRPPNRPAGHASGPGRTARLRQFSAA